MPWRFLYQLRKKKPSAKDIAVLAVLSAAAVAGRELFFMFPQFKPVAAIVTISGTALGAQAGFLVGAVSMLVSNMLFGQGMWTPWQMFAMGFLAFRRYHLLEKAQHARPLYLLLPVSHRYLRWNNEYIKCAYLHDRYKLTDNYRIYHLRHTL